MRILETSEIPEVLLEIPQPPKKLYIVGTLPSPDAIYLTIVGSRKHTTYGRDACEKLIAGLRGFPVVIISGLALGMDTIAHEAALEAGITTIAFPGSGLDPQVVYPRANFVLAKRIIENGGALISECEPLQRAAEWTFPRRNRLLTGLSRAVLIIEAEEQSGTLITARLATEYNRDVLAVPGSIFSEASKGTNWLIRQGATPITNSNDLLAALGFKTDTAQTSPHDDVECGPEEKEILEQLYEPRSRDELIRTLKKPAHEINMTLSIMEIKGLVKEEFGEIRRI